MPRDGHPPAPLPKTEIAEPSAPGELRGLVLVTAGPDVGRAVSIASTKPVTFGRSDECTLVFDEGGLSRVHAQIVRAGDDYLVRDLGSTNGTFVNDHRVETETRLEDGDRIRLGSSIRLRFSLVDEMEEQGLLGVRETSRRVSRLLEETAGRPPSTPARVVRAPNMHALYEQAYRAARSPISVLLLGETGAGKEVLGHAIHMASPRADKPYLALNCAALSESLLEAELFGHEKGAFTGALVSRAGLLESADGGTVFLDEIGELPASVQVKLLRVLEDRKVTRVGGRTVKQVDVRFVSATNRDLEVESEKGSFRKDLFFRLNGISLTIPPLRERVEEIPELAVLFAASAARRMERGEVPSISAEFLVAVKRHGWPGNVRELRNVIERAVVLCAGSTLLPEHLPPKMLEPAGWVAARDGSPPSTRASGAQAERPSGGDDLKTEIGALERTRILDAMERCGGNQTAAAEMLGMSRRTLVARLSEWGMTKPRRAR